MASALPWVRAVTGPSRLSRGRSQVGREPVGDVLVESGVVLLDLGADVRRHLRSQRLEVLLHDRALADVVLVVALEEGRQRFVDGVLGGVAGQGVLATQGAGVVGVGLPAVGGGLVDGNRDVLERVALGVDQGAAAGLVAGEADGDEVEAGVLEDDAAGVRHVQDGARGVGAFAGDDDGGGGLADVVVDQLQQLVQVGRVAGRGVEQEHPGRPDVVVDAAGAGGRDVGVVPGGPVDGGDGGREDLRGRRAFRPLRSGGR